MYDKDIRQDEEMKRTLIEKAIEVLPNSYAPYSKFNVAAAALFESGEIYTGVNVESASLGATICAERNAIFHAIAQGERKLLAVAVVGGKNGVYSEHHCVPCGICRQVMRDFADKHDMIVLSAQSPDDYHEYTLDEILPHSFGPEHLG
ncbi:MAG: cytidine deaminase [Mogibacterium sp.]|nr:cytidine deaminase [Mogibacterium sp.]